MGKMKLDIPEDCEIKSDPKRPRLTTDQAKTVINCLLTGKPKKFEKIKCSGIKGLPQYEFCEANADDYRLAFFCHGDAVTSLFILVTPSGKEWFINREGEKGHLPTSSLGYDAENALTNILLGEYLQKNYRIVPLWKIHRGGADPSFPTSWQVYHSEKSATDALSKFKQMLAEKQDPKTKKKEK